MRFLLEWQHLTAQARMQGAGGVGEVLEQLEGVPIAAAAWEAHVLPSRVSGYDPAWLDQLCLSGKVVWMRSGNPSRPQRPQEQAPDGATEPSIPLKRAASPIRTTPVALFQRTHIDRWMPFRDPAEARSQLSANAATIAARIETSGASFFGDIVRGTGLLATQVEVALAELVAQGLITADGFTGLRALLVPSDKRRPLRARPGLRSRARFGIEDAGRWVSTAPATGGDDATDDNDRAPFLARLLLRRYGVVFKRMLEKEAASLPWRDLLRELRRLEARGEIRGGRFVAGFTGEQHALPEAVSALRAQRRAPRTGEHISISAADPLNQVGILTPGERVPSHADNRILYEDGVAIAVRMAGDVRFLVQQDPAREWQVRQALVQQLVPPSLRSYLKHAG
jgi:ATP-dependent Lhr-like helicase